MLLLTFFSGDKFAARLFSGIYTNAFCERSVFKNVQFRTWRIQWIPYSCKRPRKYLTFFSISSTSEAAVNLQELAVCCEVKICTPSLNQNLNRRVLTGQGRAINRIIESCSRPLLHSYLCPINLTTNVSAQCLHMHSLREKAVQILDSVAFLQVCQAKICNDGLFFPPTLTCRRRQRG